MGFLVEFYRSRSAAGHSRNYSGYGSDGVSYSSRGRCRVFEEKVSDLKLNVMILCH